MTCLLFLCYAFSCTRPGPFTLLYVITGFIYPRENNSFKNTLCLSKRVEWTATVTSIKQYSLYEQACVVLVTATHTHTNIWANVMFLLPYKEMLSKPSLGPLISSPTALNKSYWGAESPSAYQDASRFLRCPKFRNIRNCFYYKQQMHN